MSNTNSSARLPTFAPPRRIRMGAAMEWRAVPSYGLTVSTHLDLTPSLGQILVRTHLFLQSKKLARLSSRPPGCPTFGKQRHYRTLRRRFKAFVSCRFPGDRGFSLCTHVTASTIGYRYCAITQGGFTLLCSSAPPQRSSRHQGTGKPRSVHFGESHLRAAESER
jgi:hypothetical protein